MADRDRFAPSSGSVTRVQDPYGAIQEASRSPRDRIKSLILGLFGGDENTSLQTGARDAINQSIVDVAGPVRNPVGITQNTPTAAGYLTPGVSQLNQNIQESFFGSVLPSYVQSTQMQGSGLVPPVAPFGTPPYFTQPDPAVFERAGGLFGTAFPDDQDDRDDRSSYSNRGPYGDGNQDDLLDSIGRFKIPGAVRSEAGDVITSALGRYQAEQYAAFQDSIKGFSQQYEDRIGDLQDELDGYKGGLAGVNSAYSEYATDADAILKEAASVTQEALPESEAPTNVAATFDQFDGAMADALNKMNANGNDALAQEMSEQMSYLEDTITDGLRSKIASQANLHQLAGAQSQALANMAWKDDLYNAEKSRFETELQIQAQISGKQDQISKAQREMDRALAEARAQYQEEMPTPDQLWDYALNDYFKVYGLNDIQAQELRNTWDGIYKNNPQALENYDTFKSEIMFSVNQKNMMRAGIWDNFTNSLNGLPEDTAFQMKEALGQFDFTSVGLRGVPANLANMFFPGQLETLRALPEGDRVSMSDPAYTSVLDLWSHWKSFVKDYDPTPFVPTGGGSQAPNNVANINHPDYKYRRETVVPYFAEQIGQRFPGVEFGGVHFTDKSRTTVSSGMNVNREGTSNPNSDHTSGGAMDIYFKSGTPAQTNQKLVEIAAYLRLQPWASLVVYEGQKQHQTGTNNAHAHVSFPVGYKI